MDYEKLKDFLNENDRFCKFCGIKLTAIAAGYAEAEVEINESLVNGRNVAQGGVIMTLADFAFAGAINSTGVTGVSLNCQTNFIRPGSGRMKAIARKVNQGKKTAVYSVEVFNGDGKLAATVGITGFIIDDKPIC